MSARMSVYIASAIVIPVSFLLSLSSSNLLLSSVLFCNVPWDGRPNGDHRGTRRHNGPGHLSADNRSSGQYNC